MTIREKLLIIDEKSTHDPLGSTTMPRWKFPKRDHSSSLAKGTNETNSTSRKMFFFNLILLYFIYIKWRLAIV